MTHKEVVKFKKYIRKNLLESGLKQCSRCGKIGALDEFPQKCRDSYCNKCHTKATNKSRIRNISNCYVKSQIKFNYKINYSEIPEELIAVVKERIKLTRKLRQLKNERKGK